tara:strand:+ start:6431 stop:6901 length:471 start_codon:yes stop_codon:yes gene_type:complete
MVSLPNDIFDYILTLRIDKIESEINNLLNKINNIKIILNPLIINKNIDSSYLIKYDFINYSLNNYLFDIAVNGKVFIIYPGYIYDNNSEFASDLLINPTYFRLLFEVNKNYYKFKHYYNNNILNFKSLIIFDESKLKMYGIKPNNNITYIQLDIFI